MTPKPLFSFENLASTGLDNIPLNGLIYIADADGAGLPRLVKLTSLVGITPASTIALLLATPTHFEEIGAATGLPDATGKAGFELGSDGTSAEASVWSPIRTNPNTITANYTLQAGTSGSVVSGFTIADGVTLTIPTGSILTVV